MPLVTIAIVLIVAGVLLWLVTTYIPMDATIKKILVAVVIIGIVIWLLNVTGLLGNVEAIKLPHR